MKKQTQLKGFYRLKILLVIALLFLAPQLTFAQEIEYDNFTSILVGKLASVDSSTMTSHSCDSRTDRTWINVVPHKKYQAGEMCKIYFQPKRTKGPDDSDMMEM